MTNVKFQTIRLYISDTIDIEKYNIYYILKIINDIMHR